MFKLSCISLTLLSLGLCPLSFASNRSEIVPIGAPLQGTSIEGRVIDEVTGEPLEGVVVTAWLGYLVRYAGALTDSDGRYRIEGLVSATVYLTTLNELGYADEAYGGEACLGGGEPSQGRVGCNPEKVAIPLDLPENGSLRQIDFALKLSGKIAGRLTDEVSGLPVLGEASLQNSAGRFIARVDVDSEGRYEFVDLAEGAYFVRGFTFDNRYWGESYGGGFCPGPGQVFCDARLEGEGVSVVSGGTTRNIDIPLVRSGEVHGSIVAGGEDRSWGLEIWDSGGLLNRRLIAGTDRQFRSGYLRPGRYHLRFDPINSLSPFVAEVFPNTHCHYSLCDPYAADGLEVRSGATEAVEIELERAAEISGRLIASSTGSPVGDVRSVLLDSEGRRLGIEAERSVGTFSFKDLPPGDYKVLAEPEANSQFAGQLYRNVPCTPGICDVAAADVVSVDFGQEASGIDFFLTDRVAEECVDDLTTHCLADGRFRVRAIWSDPRRETTESAFARPFTDDTGAFWFFEQNNLELVLKIVDACAEQEPRFWIFAAGLTNLEVRLEVVDLWTGVVWLEGNDFGTSFVPVQDTAAFDTCEAQRPEGWRSVDGEESHRAHPTPHPIGAIRSLAGAAEGVGNCAPGPNRLCLQGGRFAVEAAWAIPSGASGSAMSGALTEDTGYFWFFDEKNVELLVKVLDACDLEAYRTFWVFATGLTNVETTIRVTDTATNEMREYDNAQGTAFQPRFDTEAFGACSF